MLQKLGLAAALAAAFSFAACSNGGSSGGSTTGTSAANGSSGGASGAGSTGGSSAGASSGGSTARASGGSSSGSSASGTAGSTGASSGSSGGTSTGGVPCTCQADGGTPLCDAQGRCLACLANSDCPAKAGTPYCVTDPNSGNYGSCIQCQSFADCATTGSVCDPSIGQCSASECRDAGGDSFCASMGYTHCDPTLGACVSCESDADCASTQGLPHCDPTTKSCVCQSASDCGYAPLPGCSLGSCGNCLFNTDCPANQSCLFVDGGTSGYTTCACTGASGCGGAYPACEGLDAGPGSCGCDANAQCGSGNVCSSMNGSQGGCQPACTANPTNCTNLSEVCDPTTGQCAACVQNSDCTANGGSYCIDAGAGATCVTCYADGQCAALDAGTPYCVFGGNQCGQCRGPSDCPSSGMDAGCDSAAYTCGSCEQNPDCPAGLGCDLTNFPYSCLVLCGLPGAPPDGGCVQCQGNSDCPGPDGGFDGGICVMDGGFAGFCQP